MSAEQKLVSRTAAVAGSGRTTFRFTPGEWDHIDRAAHEAGMTWIEWAAAAIALRPHKSKAAAVRAALLNDMLSASIFEDRADSTQKMELHEFMRYSGQLSDDDMAELLHAATVQGTQDWGGFKVHYGADQYGQDFLLIENNMRNFPHLAFAKNKEHG